MQGEVVGGGDFEVGRAEFLAEGAVAAGGGEGVVGVWADEGGVADYAGDVVSRLLFLLRRCSKVVSFRLWNWTNPQWQPPLMATFFCSSCSEDAMVFALV